MNNDKTNSPMKKMINGAKKPSIYLPKIDLTFFDEKSECDKKLLAILYWEDLTPEQKDTFSDWECVEQDKRIEKIKLERMQDPTKLRQHFLRCAEPILRDVINFAIGDATPKSSNDYYIREVWEVLKEIITSANSPAPMINLKGKEITEQINEILTNVADQKITIKEAKEYMELVSAGFNLQELPKLMQKLEAIENQS